jgi:hypothetical protein
MALNCEARRRRFLLAIAGICFGAAIAVKWNGLEFILCIYVIWLCAWVVRLFSSLRSPATDSALSVSESVPSLPRLSGSPSTSVFLCLWRDSSPGCGSVPGFSSSALPVVTFCVQPTDPAATYKLKIYEEGSPRLPRLPDSRQGM